MAQFRICNQQEDLTTCKPKECIMIQSLGISTSSIQDSKGESVEEIVHNNCNRYKTMVDSKTPMECKIRNSGQVLNWNQFNSRHNQTISSNLSSMIKE